MSRAVVLCLALSSLFAPVVLAGQADKTAASAPSPAASSPRVDFPFAFDGPPAPVPPAVISRDGSGRATIRAVRLTTPPRIDGRLDEPIYSTVPSVSDFIQVEPQAGAPATEKTEIWVAYDDDNVYVLARCWETHPERIIAREMRRDHNGIVQGSDLIAFMFDTFYDRRNSFLFEVSAIGGRYDGQVSNERQSNRDWNAVWNVKTARFEGGWTVEAAVPFKSIRYQSGRAQLWGFNVRRNNRWKNETSFITRIPNSLGDRGIFQASLAATLVGLEAPPPGRNLEIKPSVLADLTTDTSATPRISNDVGADFGFDVKYGVSQGLTADFTYNTDFAQVEADEQQVNLTRFSLFFPEKRDFFLENQGLFNFGVTSSSGGTGDVPIMFYSRRIGLNQGRVVPVDAGGRLTGRVGRYSLALLSIRTDDEPVSRSRPTNFSVLRLKRDVFRRSNVGLLVTDRSVRQIGIGRDMAYGADATFAFFDNLALNAYWAQTRTSGFLRRHDTSYRAQLDYTGDRYGVEIEHLVVGANFNPEVGFVRRGDVQRNFAHFRFSPRPRASELVRRFVWQGSMAYTENSAGRVESRDMDAGFTIELQNSDRFAVEYNRNYEFLPAPFRIAGGVVLPVAGYKHASARAAYTFGQKRRMSGMVSIESGPFYSGRKTTFNVSQGRLNLSAQLSVEPSYQVNSIELTEGSFTTHLLGSRVTYTMTPLMFVSALLQYNSGTQAVSSNARLRWEYQPGSELFVVYNEERDTSGRHFPGLQNRAFIVKINRLFRF